MSRKILIILISVLIVFIVALLIYNFFFRKTMVEIGDETEEGLITISPTLEPSGAVLNVVSREPAISPTFDRGKIKYFSGINGNLLQADFNGMNPILVSPNALSNIINMIWSPTDKSKVIGLFEQDNQIEKYFYDYKANQSILLDKNIRYTNWSPDGKKIAYQYYDPQNQINNISIANPDGSNWKNIFTTRIKNLIVEWPADNHIAVRTKPSGLAQSVVYFIDTTSSEFEKIISNAYGLTTLWSPKGNKILFSETNSSGQNLKLKLIDIETQNIVELGFATLPEKCAWSRNNHTIFCAIPRIIADEAILPDDYYKDLAEFTDNVYKIDLDTGQVDLIFESSIEADLDIDNPLLSNQEDYLIFVNKKDGWLYSLGL